MSDEWARELLDVFIAVNVEDGVIEISQRDPRMPDSYETVRIQLEQVELICKWLREARAHLEALGAEPEPPA